MIWRGVQPTRLALLGIAATIATQAAHAQSQLFAGDFAANSAARGVNPFKPGPDDATVIPAPAKRVTGEPRSFQVVSVDIPEALPVNRPIQYEVIQGGSNVILSSRSGVLSAQATRPSALLVTLQVPAAPRAGSLSLAKVRFSVAGETPIEVPIELVVARAGHVEVTALEGLRAVRTGETFTMSYRVTNLRNAVETVEIQAIAPAGWRVRQSQPAVTLAVNSAADRFLTVSIPAESNTGGASIRLIAVAQGRPVASVDIPVQVLGGGLSAGPGGPVVTTAAGFGTDATGKVVSAYTLAVDGQLSDDIRVSGRTTLLPGGQSAGSYGLSQAGMYALPPSLELSARTWRVGLGTASAQLTDLTGFSVGGNGALVALMGRRVSGSSFLARPLAGARITEDVNRSRGALAGGRLDVEVGAGKITGAASHLSEDGLDPRHLEAVSLGATIPVFFNGTFSSEVAARSYDDGRGLGWSANYGRRSAANQINVRVSQAPGGVAAFAQATSQVQASVAQTVGRVGLNGSYYRNADDSRAGFSSLVSSGWSISAQLRVTNLLSLGLDTHGSDFSAVGPSGTYGSGETSVGGSLNLRTGGRYATIGGSVAQVDRLTTALTGTSLNDAALRTSSRAAVGVTGRLGVYEVAAQMDRSGSGVGFLPRQLGFSARVDRIPVLSSGSTRLFATGSAQRTSWFGDRAATTGVRSGLSLELSPQFAVSLSAERNPFILSSSGSAGWMYTLKVDRRTVLPRLARTTTGGVVFEDRNGNGRRDSGEPGLRSALVRRGQESDATSKDGEFQFEGAAADTIVIDPMSLPMGWIVGKTTRDGKRWNLATVAVSAMEIDLLLTPEAALRVDSAAVNRVVVMARDERGRTWIARSTPHNRLVFDALPVGRYTVQLDVADIEEPLTPTVDPIEFQVSTGSASPRLTITLRPRPVKVKMMNPQAAPKPAPNNAPASPTPSKDAPVLAAPTTAAGKAPARSR